MTRICIQWPRFGPYHVARLEAVGLNFRDRGIEVVGLETASSDGTYSWQSVTGASAFSRETVFPERKFDSIHPRVMESNVRATLDRVNPDAVAVSSYSLPDARACLSWCRSHNRAVVVMTDSQYADAPRVWWREKVKAKILSQFGAAFVGGIRHRDYLSRLGFDENNVRLGCDVVDNEYFASVAERSADSGIPRYGFLSVNRFIPRKNLSTLVNAYSIYRTQTPDPWPLTLVGDGPGKEALVESVNSSGLAGVRFVSNMNLEALAQLYAASGVLIHPAIHDQWGLVVNEAMASGLPVLVSKGAGCVDDLVEDGLNGYSFESTDPNELARRMLEVSSDDSIRARMSTHSQAVIARWSLETFANNLFESLSIAERNIRRDSALSPAVLLWLLRHLSRSPSAFHSVDA